ncbi:MAG TPA: TorF family putative porin [Burkholderiaceae bacterium]|nr:TorF family putative porin [Burkholderiaceae bacterium]
MRGRRHLALQPPALNGALALALLLAAGGAAAQASGSASLVSDYRFRGLSLSDGNPSAQLGLNYDSPGGWYAGGQAAGANLHERDMVQLTAYGGLAQRLASGWSWEAGASASGFTRRHDSDYTEWYAGLASERIGLRLYYSPRYFGRDMRTAYGEVNGFYPLHDKVKLVAHGGVLRYLPHAGDSAGLPARYDGRLGLAAALGDWNVQLAWVAASSRGSAGAAYPSADYAPSRQALVLSVAYAF